jgi:signal transduction histidine kinase
VQAIQAGDARNWRWSVRSRSLNGTNTMHASPSVTASDSIGPPRVGRILLIACWLAVVYGVAETVPGVRTGRGLATWISTFVFLGSFSLVVTRLSADRLISISGLAAVAIQFLAPNNGAFVAVVAVIAVSALRLDAPSGRFVAAVCGVGFLVASAASAHPLSSGEMVSVVPALLFTYLGSTALRRLRMEQQKTRELLQEVIAGRDAVIRAAALDEQAHLAREMHDVLAHTLSALSIQLEGARLLAEQSSCVPEVATALERTSGLAREGLGEARRAVGSLRGEILPGPDLLPQLVQEFEYDVGVPCRLRIEGGPVVLSSDARLAMYRIAQEALTNVRKHTDSSAVDITLRTTVDSVELVVENEGTPVASRVPGGGYGVSGMRERAELLNGTLQAVPTAKGFKVWLWIPTRPSERSGS